MGWIYSKIQVLSENHFQFSLKQFLRTMISKRGSIAIPEQIHHNCMIIEFISQMILHVAQPAWGQLLPMG